VRIFQYLLIIAVPRDKIEVLIMFMIFIVKGTPSILIGFKLFSFSNLCMITSKTMID
jgi:hypothetical protein